MFSPSGSAGGGQRPSGGRGGGGGGGGGGAPPAVGRRIVSPSSLVDPAGAEPNHSDHARRANTRTAGLR